MLRRILIILAAAIVASFLQGIEASAAACPVGYHWVEVAVEADGQALVGSYSDSRGYCAKDDDTPPSSDNSGAPGSEDNPICVP